MPQGVLLTIYCVAILLASLAGGALPAILRLTHRRMQIALSFVAGVMLGIGLLHLIPHAYYELNSIDDTVAWALGGFLVMFFLERFFHFHHHEAPDELLPDGSSDLGDRHEHAHDVHAHDHGHDHTHPTDVVRAHPFSWTGATIGLALHSIIDGVALAAAVAAEQGHGSAIQWAGLGTFLAVVLHKPFDSMSIGTLMSAAGWSASARLAVNALYALTIPCGVLVFHLGLSEGHVVLGQALAFAAGAFLCIATSDLLPELQFHSHDRGKLSIALVLGVLLAYAIVFFEAQGHDHLEKPTGAAHEHSHAEDHEHGDAAR